MSVAKTRGTDRQTVTGIVSFPFKYVGGSYSRECSVSSPRDLWGVINKVQWDTRSNTEEAFLCYCICLKHDTREEKKPPFPLTQTCLPLKLVSEV